VVQRASAIIVSGVDPEQAEAIGTALRAERVFRLRRYLEPPRLVEPAGRVVSPVAGTRVLALAGLARPARVFADLAGEGWTVAGEMVFGDHHRYTSADLARIVSEMRAVCFKDVATTEKDLVRLLPLRPFPVPVAWVPLQVSVEPAAEFREWIGRKVAMRNAELRMCSTFA